ncbi:aminomethyltransferase [Lysobacter enzymogenes]|uniref:Aminomethyltransferase n=1 Tax=Lysobacter enzymogenes TaxID=69 RepID=A0A0S2DIC7_LYSEN|nr:folate-binding protein YgfZ [Lysobacter enzymogenes]ALN58395.1 aminomethyltransferase [Lysobacter enzymogenes]QCW26795.1 folate-binding protein YgfZ [Lysobacter enzymogenes]
MPDNPHALPGQAFALPGQRLIALEGRDAAAFAQAQFMNDVKGLADGHWQWSGWLTPKGRAVALFALLRLSEQRIWLVVPDADADALVEALKRFVFRSKVAIGAREDQVIEGRFGAPERAAGAVIDGDGDDSVEIDLSGDGGARTLRIVATGRAAAADADLAERWAEADLRHGLPRLPASQAGQWTPQQLSLDRLRGYSVKKGCYPGQEIVARTHFLGKAKRGLALYRCEGPVETGAKLMAGEETLGEIVARAGEWALAVAGLDREPTPAQAGATLLQPQPLSAGLER